MPSDLATGVLPYSGFTAKLLPVPFPKGACPTTIADIGAWIGQFAVEFKTALGFGYSAGTIDAATPEDRAFPRLLFSQVGSFMGIGIWSPDLGAWTIGAAIGEMKTIVLSAATVAADMVNKGFTNAGWHLADGTAGTQNYTAKAGFFEGSGPDWTVYTIEFTGA